MIKDTAQAHIIPYLKKRICICQVKHCFYILVLTKLTITFSYQSDMNNREMGKRFII